MVDGQPEWVGTYLRELVVSGDARRAAGRAEVDIGALFDWRERSRDFSVLCEAALMLRADLVAAVEAQRTTAQMAPPSALRAATSSSKLGEE
jgi:hypothetical protein